MIGHGGQQGAGRAVATIGMALVVERFKQRRQPLGDGLGC
jgi:hypothetical protein